MQSHTFLSQVFFFPFSSYFSSLLLSLSPPCMLCTILRFNKDQAILLTLTESSTSFGEFMRMEHINHFQQWLFFMGLGMLLSLALFVKANDSEGSNDRRGITLNARSFVSNYENRTTLSRKLLRSTETSSDTGQGTNRMGQNCAKEDIVVVQGSTVPLPNGVPAYTVQIFNTCGSGCRIAEIHVSCGWFSSVRLVNPRVFRRLSYDDCLVNDGQPLAPGQTLSFQYANSFSYPLSVSSVSCF